MEAKKDSSKVPRQLVIFSPVASIVVQLVFLRTVKLMAIAPEQPIHHCRINLKKFTILYQDAKTWNSLPVQITSLSSFPNVKKNLLEFLVLKIVTEMENPHTAAISM